ncbi:MAG: hypothetical protein ABIK09_03395 [Pseudomonadota bacterium]
MQRQCPVAVLFLVLVLTTACRGDGQALSEQPTDRSFEIPGNRPYTETELTLSPDTEYRFRHVGGRVCYQGADRCAPPRGSDVPDDEAWALHLKLGKQLVPYQDGMVLSVEEETRLVFYLPEGDTEEYNDDKLPLYADNTGSFRIEVEERPTPQSAGMAPGVAVAPGGADRWCEPGVAEGMKRLAEIGARQVLLPVPHLTDGRTIWPGSRTPRVLCLVRATKAAREHGLTVVWSVEVEPADHSPVASLDPADRGAFFAAYGEVARVFAELAQAEGVELLSAGSGLTSLTKDQKDRDRWVKLFLDLHTRYFGTLFYTADRVELEQIDAGFWRSCCDRVGVRPDYSLSDATLPSAQQLAAAWEPHLETLEAVFQETGLRLVLVGAPAYPATTRCAFRPMDAIPDRVPDELCQLEAYRAWFDVFAPAAAQFSSDYFLGEIAIVGPQSPLSPLTHLSEEILVDAWK